MGIARDLWDSNSSVEHHSVQTKVMNYKNKANRLVLSWVYWPDTEVTGRYFSLKFQSKIYPWWAYSVPSISGIMVTYSPDDQKTWWIWTNNRPVCFIFERARALSPFVKGRYPLRKFLLSEHFKGTTAMARGHWGNCLHCLREVSGLKWKHWLPYYPWIFIRLWKECQKLTTSQVPTLQTSSINQTTFNTC